MKVTAKQVANTLLNMPRENREWLMTNVSPDTFSRWMRQGINVSQRVDNLRDEKEELSDLAMYEFKAWVDSL